MLVAEATSLARTLPGDHPFTVNGSCDAVVRADLYRIGQVLRNLLSNAAKYSRPGTSIELRVAANGDRVRLEVADQGHGIHPDDLKRVFEKFGRGRDEAGRKIPGVGLGLYLSRRIIQAHGADLEVNSTPGVGSVFGFELEIVRDSRASDR
jgi:signal transduction histidine kinase